jgi:hypothetical protein
MGTILRLSEDLWRGFRGVLQEENRIFAAIFVEGLSFPFAHVYSDATEYMYGGINCKKGNEADREGKNTRMHQILHKKQTQI